MRRLQGKKFLPNDMRMSLGTSSGEAGPGTGAEIILSAPGAAPRYQTERAAVTTPLTTEYSNLRLVEADTRLPVMDILASVNKRHSLPQDQLIASGGEFVESKTPSPPIQRAPSEASIPRTPMDSALLNHPIDSPNQHKRRYTRTPHLHRK
jgi:hypothetical protein